MRIISNLNKYLHKLCNQYVIIEGVRNCSHNTLDNGRLKRLEQKLEEHKNQLRRESRGCFKFRHISSVIDNLKKEISNMDVESKRQKLDNQLAPTTATLEVLSNGTASMTPSLILRTLTRCYMFNCPEGSSRCIPLLRVKPNQTHDFFITRATWDNFGGIFGILLGKADAIIDESTRLHSGSRKLKQYLDLLRPLIDTDFGGPKGFPVHFDECTYEQNHFEDSAISVHYIPVYNPDCSTSTSSSVEDQTTVDVAFLVQLKPSPPKIDPMKLLKLKVPKRASIGKLKFGETITLEDGRVITLDDVRDDNALQENTRMLVVEICSEAKLATIAQNSILQDYTMGTGSQKLDYVVHFTPIHIYNLPEYKGWLKSFGPDCSHLLMNGMGNPVPQSDCVRGHIMLGQIFPDGFPQLFPDCNFAVEKLLQDDESMDLVVALEEEGIGRIVAPRMGRRFKMRGRLHKDEPDPIAFDFSKEIEHRLTKGFISEDLSVQLEHFGKILKKTMAGLVKRDLYPTICFLGTGSACPSKYRNVSSYLLQLGPQSNVLVDCGEATYGQLRTLFGPQRCAELLTNLNAIFITHAHQDHIHGIYTVLHRRIDAFKQLGIPYKPLILVCDRNTRRPLEEYSRSFFNLLPYLSLIELNSFFKRATTDFPSVERLAFDVAKHLPSDLYSAEEWNLHSVHAVQVPHTRLSCGFVFVCMDGRKVVFSGDTKPCELLEEYGSEADVLVHECTFQDGMEVDADRKKHSTMGQAFHSGQRMRAKNIILTHFSIRYSRIPPLPDYLVNAGNVSVAMDFMVTPFDLLPLFPKLLPLYRALFHEELFEMGAKQISRTNNPKPNEGNKNLQNQNKKSTDWKNQRQRIDKR